MAAPVRIQSKIHPDNFDATESCDGTNRSVSVSRCQLFEAGFPAVVLHLNDPSCKGVAQDGRLVFHFDDNTCGSILEVNSTNFIYKNSIQSFSSVGSRSVVSRDSWLNLNFSCVYPLIQSISAPMTFQAINSVISKNLPGAEGTYQIRMVPYSDASFTSSFSGTVTLQVNQQVFIAVEVDGVDSQVFSTVLDNCWATPYNNPNHYIRWDLISKECPNAKDGTVQVLQNGVSISSHFSFRMFTFTGVSDSFYLHCRVHLCQVNGGHCALPCDDDDGDEDDGHPIVRRRRSLDFHDSTSISMSF
ncbi:uromodulin-like [Pygocentrus nattereri]|uniref:uromodulin-like n=1 Tax=Pygocentrus nattereri TaxID=42514 RepID=UPI001891CCF4|nr:uromodulin-like [Pygocentrus nattereri]